MIVKFTAEKKDQWYEFLDTCVFAYNTAKHESTLYTPFQLMFGRKGILPIDIEFDSQDGKHLLKDFEILLQEMLVERKFIIVLLFFLLATG